MKKKPPIFGKISIKSKNANSLPAVKSIFPTASVAIVVTAPPWPLNILRHPPVSKDQDLAVESAEPFDEKRNNAIFPRYATKCPIYPKLKGLQDWSLDHLHFVKQGSLLQEWRSEDTLLLSGLWRSECKLCLRCLRPIQMCQIAKL